MAAIKWFLLFSNLWSYAVSCPSNCVCDDFEAQCYIDTGLCSLENVFLETLELQLEGKLCPSLRKELENISLPPMFILNGDACESLPQCM